MRLSLLLLLMMAMSSRTVLAASAPGVSPGEATSIYNDRVANELKQEPASKDNPGIRACMYYGDNYRIYDVLRLEMHSKTCQSDKDIEGQSIDKTLPDRPDSEIYRVGEPFDVPKRN